MTRKSPIAENQYKSSLHNIYTFGVMAHFRKCTFCLVTEECVNIPFIIMIYYI